MRLWHQTSATSVAVAARAAHAAVEGTAFPLTPKGFACLVLVHNAAVAYCVGPGKALGLVLQATVVCTVGRFALILLTTLPQMRGVEQEYMQSIYHWNPPGELGESGAWQVVKTLASIFSKTDDSMPGISDLDSIPFHELFVRLCYKFNDTENDPDIDSNPEGGTREGIDDAFIDTLALYLHFSDVIYEATSEEMLLAVLKEKGYALNFAKMSAEWGTEHTPAYFVATNTDKKELLVCIRGTGEVQDVLADITAFPVEFDGTGHQVHSGMLASALWLCKRIISLAKVAQKAGYRLTLAGHSLGAASAVMLAMLLKRRGIEDLYVYGIATPACMAKELALSCRDYVQSVAFRDDVVVRVSPGEKAGETRYRCIEQNIDKVTNGRVPTGPGIGTL
ncbi:hypothetical protein WJX73_001382 [Symbiochloris irregularis]|uniref:Fungal lipase-type domain-containing protein n=1 Tax=Symbiochloris irregularis TaxID=706552 RepID=A0AAW1PHJ3_9CHLO